LQGEYALVEWVGQTKEPLLIQDVSHDKRWTPFDEAVRSALFIPAVYEEIALGVMVFLNTEVNAFTEKDVQNGMTLAGSVAIAIRNARLYEQAQQEIAERTQAETALLKSQVKLTQAQRLARLGNWEWDSINNTVTLSNEIYRIFSLEPLQLKVTFEDFLTWIHPGDKELVNRSIQETLSNHKTLRIDHRVILPDGTERVVYQQAEVVFNERGQVVGMMGTMQDITERRKLEDQLRQAQKMEAIGRLAGGVAHDFNNLLTIIMSSSEFLLERYTDDDDLSRDINQIRKASDRAAALTRQLLAFSRQQILQPKALNLNGVITDIEKMLRRLIGEDINLVVVLEKELGWIKADQGQIEQVIMNLVVNSRDAMPQGGELIIETANIYLDEGYTHHYFEVTPGPYVLLTVSDTGRGMEPDIRDRIFEPFFTTKEAGQGTGLGLATVHGIVSQSGGHIWVYSEPNKGSTFKIYLPQAKQTGVDLNQQKQPEVVTLLGSETILLVEDDEIVRKLIRQILTGYGYAILEASYGREALAICQNYAGVIHLLLTDIIMPGGMNGRELAEQVVLLFPQIKVLYVSGYSGEVIARHNNLASNTPFISKPFSPTVLGQKVREVLDSKVTLD
jgi:signal transduction histidine kinase/CheY-like chemotaxis protein